MTTNKISLYNATFYWLLEISLDFFTLEIILETITVQAPHPPSAQPSFVPLSPTAQMKHHDD